ncbi:hypothetical protein QT990_20335 [Microcoleus sp. T3_B1]|uniref:hypothetical protein n=1 Tax=Microcoleus sp. T3_B1 TaxID=3055425 RepID=UPI002FD3A097
MSGLKPEFLGKSHILHHSITCLGTGKMPVPQENSLFVERAGEPVLDKGATSE